MLFETLALKLENYKVFFVVLTVIFIVGIALSGVFSSAQNSLFVLIDILSVGFIWSWGGVLVISWFHPVKGGMKNESLDKWAQSSHLPTWSPKVFLTIWFIVPPLLILLK